ncbi:MAG: hypothetical protein JXM73_09235 [Anaerolineae bacterium]|nr:hypothetical protein [Anaerolineae bacterium]
MGKRFTALRVIATIFKVLGWIALLVGLLGAVLVLVAYITLDFEAAGVDFGGPLAGVVAFIVILLLAVIQFLILYAVGESIYVFLSIEESSRRAAYFSQQLFAASQSGYTVPPPDYEE